MVRITGRGAVARAAALALAGIGLGVRVDAARPGRPDDVRAYALNAASLALLERLGVLARLPPDATTAVHGMHVRGDRDGTLDFSAFEQRTDRLAAIVDAAALDAALQEAVEAETRIAVAGDSDGEGASGRPAGADAGSAPGVGSIADAVAELHVHAEGRDAASRDARGAGFVHRPYGQRAIAARLVASQPHAHTARQWFRHPDVLALLPMDRPVAGRSFALVWSLPDARAGQLLAADGAAFERALNDAIAGAGEGAAPVGTLALASPRAAWPLAEGRAERWCGPGWLLVGDAAHVVHPLAGQGLNLGLGDVAELVRVLAEREPWRSVGDERLLRRVVRRRAAHTAAMMTTIDGLQQLFSARGALAATIRNNGVSLVERAGPLKRWLANRALGS